MAREDEQRYVAQNRKARYDYFIQDTLEAGLMLTGTEVKSLRAGKANLSDAYAEERDGALWLVNAHIAEYDSGGYMRHGEKRARKLLLKKREIGKLAGAAQRDGITLVPLSIYFNDRGIAKVQLGLARGKKHADKRATEAKRDWERQKARIIRDKS